MIFSVEVLLYLFWVSDIATVGNFFTRSPGPIRRVLTKKHFLLNRFDYNFRWCLDHSMINILTHIICIYWYIYPYQFLDAYIFRFLFALKQFLQKCKTQGWIFLDRFFVLKKNLPLQGPLPGLAQVWVRCSRGKAKMILFDISLFFWTNKFAFFLVEKLIKLL